MYCAHCDQRCTKELNCPDRDACYKSCVENKGTVSMCSTAGGESQISASAWFCKCPNLNGDGFWETRTSSSDPKRFSQTSRKRTFNVAFNRARRRVGCNVRFGGMLCRCPSRSWRRHNAELPQRRQIVDDPALPENLAVTDLENHNLVELGALPGGRQRPPLTFLCS